MGYHDDLEEVSDGDEQRSRCSDGYPSSYGAREAEQRSLCDQHIVGYLSSLHALVTAPKVLGSLDCG